MKNGIGTTFEILDPVWFIIHFYFYLFENKKYKK